MRYIAGNPLLDYPFVVQFDPASALVENLPLFAHVGIGYGKLAYVPGGLIAVICPYQIRYDVMAQTKLFSGTEFVNVRVPASDKPKVEKWAKEMNYDPIDFLLLVISDGYKLSISADPDKSCVIVSLTGKAQRGVNARCTMTSRGPDFDAAMLVTAYKHIALFDQNQWVAEEGGDSWG